MTLDYHITPLCGIRAENGNLNVLSIDLCQKIEDDNAVCFFLLSLWEVPYLTLPYRKRQHVYNTSIETLLLPTVCIK